MPKKRSSSEEISLYLKMDRDALLDMISSQHKDFEYYDFLDDCYYRLGDMWKEDRKPINKRVVKKDKHGQYSLFENA